MSVTFEYPLGTPTSTVVLRNPELGNTKQYNIKTQFNRSMDGTIYGTIDTPVSETLILSFSEISKPDMDAFILFFKASTGFPIQYTDHESNIWQGTIVNTQLEITTSDRKGGSCIEVNTFSLQFRGSIVNVLDVRLLEDGTNRLLESGDVRLLESA